MAAERWSEGAEVARAAVLHAAGSQDSAGRQRARARLAFALLQLGDYSGAAAEYEELFADEGGEELAAGADQGQRAARAKNLSNFAEALAHRGDAGRAFAVADRAVEMVSGSHRAGLEDVAVGVLCNQASLLAVLGGEGRTHEAVNVAQEALELSSEFLGRTHEYTRVCLRALAFASARHGGDDQVEGVIQDWIERGERERAQVEEKAAELYDSAKGSNIDGRLPELEKAWARAPLHRFDPPGVVLPVDAPLQAFEEYQRSK